MLVVDRLVVSLTLWSMDGMQYVVFLWMFILPLNSQFLRVFDCQDDAQ